MIVRIWPELFTSSYSGISHRAAETVFLAAKGSQKDGACPWMPA